MPRSAAVMLGLALVALSIGFNTVRYPVVWEMVSPTGANGRAEPTSMADSSQSSAETPTAQPPAAPSEPTKPIEVTTAPHVVETAAGDAPSTCAENDENAAPPTAQKGLVPVVPVALSRTSSDNAPESGVRRLPPVTPGYASPANLAQSPGGSIPVYPTTGIE